MKKQNKRGTCNHVLEINLNNTHMIQIWEVAGKDFKITVCSRIYRKRKEWVE